MYLTEIIEGRGFDLEKWGKEKRMILLEAPTGCGKTYFAQRTLPDICLQNDGHMAIIVNRKVLKEQMERYNKEYMFESNLIASPVMIFTYQQLEQDKNKETIKYLESCEFVVLDEAHYLVSDILFNPSAEKSFLELMQLVDKTCLIFMTATPGNLRLLLDEYLNWRNQERMDEYSQECIKYKEMEEQCIAGFFDGSLQGKVDAVEFYYELDEYKDKWYDPGPPPELLSYELVTYPAHSYGHIVLNCYSSQEDLVDVILNSPKRQKWLIFVNFKKEGSKLKKKIERAFKKAETDKRKVGFLSSDFRKDTEMQKIIEEIVKKESFKESVLICTSVLDNGITISDSNVQNIVINAFDECEFKQMMGRRRVKAGETINLFVYEGKLSDFKKYREREYDDYIKAFPIIGKTSYEIRVAILGKEVTWKAVEEYAFAERNDWHFSKLAYWIHSRRYVRLNDMIQKMGEDARAHVKEVCGWLLKDYDSDVRYLCSNEITDEMCKDIADKIDGLPCVISKTQYNGFVDDLNKMTPMTLSNKADRINDYLSQHEVTKKYQFRAINIAKKTFYHIEKEGKFPFVLDEDITNLETLKGFLEKNKKMKPEDIFQGLFNMKIPELFDEREQIRFMTICLQEGTGWFQGMCFRRQRGILSLVPYGNENDKEEG